VDAQLLHQAMSALEAARAAADTDPNAAMRGLRQVPDTYLLGDGEAFLESVQIVRRAAQVAGFTDLDAAAAAVAAAPTDAHLLYDYGFQLTERGVAFLAVVPLALAVASAPNEFGVRLELADALERQARYEEAVSTLAHEVVLDRWMGRYLLIFNSLLAADIDGARQWFTRLGRPEAPEQEFLAARLEGMLRRVQSLLGTDRLDDAFVLPADPRRTLGRGDLRGWHWVANESVLLTLSPHGYDEPMNGRYAFYNESFAGVKLALERLSVVLDATTRRPSTVAGLPDRSSQILAHAAALVLKRAFVPWDPEDDAQLVFAWTLSDQDAEVIQTLRNHPRQLLVEHATCWTDPAPIAADLSGLLHQVCTAPWDERPTIPRGGGAWDEGAADDRPAPEIAGEIAATSSAASSAEELDADLPDLLALIARTAGAARTTLAHRDRLFSPGPVPSARFW